MNPRTVSLMVLAVVLAACGGASTASTTPMSSASSSPLGSRSPVASSSPSPSSAVSCRLPVFNWGWVTNANGSTVVGKNGFLSLPDGSFLPDQAGVMRYDETTFLTSTQQTPTLYGDGGGMFDAAQGRWLPSGRANVLTDGSAYVYELEHQDGTGYDIHLVEVGTARDTLVYHMPYDNAYQILGFEPGSVYVYPILHRSGIPGGLWRLDIETRALSPVSNSMNMTWEWVTSGVVWGGPAGAASDSLYSLDLESGVLTKWFQHPVQGPVFEGYGYGVSVIGFDRSDHPVVQVYPPPPNSTSAQTPPVTPELWIVNAPGQAIQLTGLPIPENGLAAAVTDSHGTWIVGADGVYLYAESSFHRVAMLPPQPQPNYTLLGPCF